MRTKFSVMNRTYLNSAYLITALIGILLFFPANSLAGGVTYRGSVGYGGYGHGNSGYYAYRFTPAYSGYYGFSYDYPHSSSYGYTTPSSYGYNLSVAPPYTTADNCNQYTYRDAWYADGRYYPAGHYAKFYGVWYRQGLGYEYGSQTPLPPPPGPARRMTPAEVNPPQPNPDTQPSQPNQPPTNQPTQPPGNQPPSQPAQFQPPTEVELQRLKAMLEMLDRIKKP